MPIPKRCKETVSYNERSLSTLKRAIALSEGDFSLILAHSNSTTLTQQMVDRLGEISPLKPREIFLPKSTHTLYTTLAEELNQDQPPALMVFGLSSLFSLDPVLISANIVRNEFRKSFHFPLVLWVTDEVLRKLIRIAPDFYSWSTVAISFVMTPDELLNSPEAVKQPQELAARVRLTS